MTVVVVNKKLYKLYLSLSIFIHALHFLMSMVSKRLSSSINKHFFIQ